MDNIRSYNFNNLARMREDVPYISQRELDNKEYSDYNMVQFHDINNAENLAYSQPNINLSGYFGPDGSRNRVIESDTYLKQAELTNLNNKISLQERPFLTVPYLGRGKCEPVTESMLRKGKLTNIPNSSSGSISELNHNNITPMVDSVKKSITNPKYLVEGVADPNWVRGGVMTRNYNYNI